MEISMDGTEVDRMGWGDRERRGMTGWDGTRQEGVSSVRWVSTALLHRQQEKWRKNMMTE